MTLYYKLLDLVCNDRKADVDHYATPDRRLAAIAAIEKCRGAAPCELKNILEETNRTVFGIADRIASPGAAVNEIKDICARMSVFLVMQGRHPIDRDRMELVAPEVVRQMERVR